MGTCCHGKTDHVFGNGGVGKLSKWNNLIGREIHVGQQVKLWFQPPLQFRLQSLFLLCQSVFVN